MLLIVVFTKYLCKGGGYSIPSGIYEYVSLTMKHITINGYTI